MQFLVIAVLAVTIALVQAVSFSSIATLSLTLLCYNAPAYGFFGLFRRRGSALPQVVEQPTAPQGPIRMSNPSFPPRGGFFNPFSGGLSPGMMNVPGFSGGMFQSGGFQQRPFQQSWSSQNAPQPQSVQFPPQNSFQAAQFQQNSGMDADLQSGFDRDVRFDDQPPAINTEEAESFFTLLAETDENKCISRLVCEMGADPQSAGELGTTISEIIGSLTDFPSGSKVSEYNKVLQDGRSQGMSACLSQYTSCDEESYALMKNSQAGETQEADGS